jgi:hypothetical protein
MYPAVRPSFRSDGRERPEREGFRAAWENQFMSERSARSGRMRWLLMVTVSVASLAWVVVLLQDALPELRANLPDLDIRWLAMPLIGCIACGYIGFEAFRALLLHAKGDAYSRRTLGHLFFVAQLMKHLPGRVWGVAYQATAGGSIGLSVWASVTAAQMVLAAGTAAWMSLTVAGFARSPTLGSIALIAGAFAYMAGWNRSLLDLMLRLIGSLPGRFFNKARNALQPFVDASPRFKLRMLGLFGSYWLVYLASWAGYGFAWPGLHPLDALTLCALYTIAWLAGYFSLVTPSGIGVRELVFVFLAHRFPADAVAGLAILGRFMLLLADLALGVAFAPFVPGDRASKGAGSETAD